MEISDLARNWNTLGQQQAITSIISTLGSEDGEAFFRSGLVEVEWFLSLLNDAGIKPIGPVLDFGCGIGRLSQALAQYFDKVTGVDIAPSMLEMAEKINAFPEKCSYVLNQKDNLEIFENNSFNVVITSIVLQHVGPELARKYLSEMIRILSPGGILFFQLPSQLKEIPSLEAGFCRAKIQIDFSLLTDKTLDITDILETLNGDNLSNVPSKFQGRSDKTKTIFATLIKKGPLGKLPVRFLKKQYTKEETDRDNTKNVYGNLGLETFIGETVPIRVKITNTSGSDWHDTHKVTLGRRWLSYPENNLLAYADDGGNVSLTEGLPSGRSTEVTMMLRMPVNPGDYILELDLSQPGQPLFADLGSARYLIFTRVILPDPKVDTASPGPADIAKGEDPDVSTVVGTIEMHGILRQEVEELLLAHNMEITCILEDNSAGANWQSYRYLARRKS